MNDITPGIGSRIKHPQFGKGVIVQVRSDAFEISFIDLGLRIINRDFVGLEIIEAVESPSDLATYEKLEKSLIRVLRQFSDIQETVPMGGKWTGGKLVLVPGDKSLKEKETLLKEIHHRVKNNLTVISSLLNLQSRYIKDKDDLMMFKESQSRAKSMALIHQRLYDSSDLKRIDFGDYIKTLANEMFHTYITDSNKIKLNLMWKILCWI